jgi:hypothetical protein
MIYDCRAGRGAKRRWNEIDPAMGDENEYSVDES